MKSYFVVKGQEIDPDFAVLIDKIDGDQVFEFDSTESAEFYGMAEQLRKLKNKNGDVFIKSMICLGCETVSVSIDEDTISEDGLIDTYEDCRYKIIVCCPTFPIKIAKYGGLGSHFFEVKNMRSDNKFHYWNK